MRIGRRYVLPLSLLCFVFCWSSTSAQLSGDYTIDPAQVASPTNFTSISAAISNLESQGIDAEVRFSIASGTYTEQISIGAINGVSNAQKVYFSSATNQADDVVIEYEATSNADNFVMRLTDTDYMDFSRLSFKATAIEWGRVLEIKDGADNNRFTNCKFLGKHPNTSYQSNDKFAVIYSRQYSGNGIVNNTFEGNMIYKGTWGIYMRNNSGTKIANNLIKDNLFDDQYWIGIYLFNTDANDVIGNTITGSSIGRGMFMGVSTTRTWVVSRNKVWLNVNSNTSVTGMHFGVGTTNGSECIIRNNMINIQNNAGGLVIGFQNQNSSHLALYNNTLQTSGGSSGSMVFFDQSTSINQTGPVHMINNIFSQLSSAYTLGFSVDPNNNMGTLDYNIFHTVGPHLAKMGNTNWTDLTDYQAITSKDLNSIQRNPQLMEFNEYLLVQDNFIGDADFDARVLSDVQEDFFGAARSGTNPRKGASESGAAVTVAPVEWAYVSAEVVDQEVEIRWATFSEKDHAHFDVQRSIDGLAWENQTRIDGSGDRHSIQTYAWTDVKPMIGNNYYRIKQVDTDGTYSFSKMLEVVFDPNKQDRFQIQAFPNPTTDYFQVHLPLGSKKLVMLNSIGQQVLEVPVESRESIRLDVNDFAPGRYHLNLYKVNGLLKQTGILIIY